MDIARPWMKSQAGQDTRRPQYIGMYRICVRTDYSIPADMSFYLSSFRIHVFSKTIHDIGNPPFIRFLMKDDGQSIIMEAYHNKDFRSHRVNKRTDNRGGTEISSMPLCLLLINKLHWEEGKSYRIPGKSYPAQKLAVFDLTAAELIKE